MKASGSQQARQSAAPPGAAEPFRQHGLQGNVCAAQDDADIWRQLQEPLRQTGFHLLTTEPHVDGREYKIEVVGSGDSSNADLKHVTNKLFRHGHCHQKE